MNVAEENIYSHSFGVSAVSSNAGSCTAHRPRPAWALLQPLALNQVLLRACFASYLCAFVTDIKKKKKKKKIHFQSGR